LNEATLEGFIRKLTWVQLRNKMLLRLSWSTSCSEKWCYTEN